MGDPQRWHLVHDGHDDVVEIVAGGLTREVTWSTNGTQQATRKTSDDTVVVAGPEGAGAVRVKIPTMGPARRVTLHGSEAEAHTGLGGADFAPEAGSKAAARAEWIGRHPHLHTVRQTAVAAAGVGVPVLVVWLLTLVPWRDIDVPWPDVDLPSVPWPDLPAIPWPDVPDLPAWTEPVRKLIVPVLIAFFIARGEVKRRRRAEQKKAEEKAGTGGTQVVRSSRSSSLPGPNGVDDARRGERFAAAGAAR